MIDSKYEIQKDQYTYSIEPFGISRQGHTSVGNFKEFTNNYSVMMFDKVCCELYSLFFFLLSFIELEKKTYIY